MRENLDPDMIRARRDSAEGKTNRRSRDDRNNRHDNDRDHRHNGNERPGNRSNERPQAKTLIVTEHSEVVAACKVILTEGYQHKVQIFGLELGTYANGRKLRGPVVVIHDMVYQHELEGAVPANFEIPLAKLRINPGKLVFDDEIQEFAVRYIIEQPAWKQAKTENFKEQRAAEDAEVDEMRSRAAQKLAERAAANAKPLSSNFMTEDNGTFAYEGVVINLKKMPDRGQRPGPHLVTVIACPEGHELAKLKDGGFYVNRQHLEHPNETATGLEGRDQVIQAARVWLRAALKAVGYQWPAPEASTEEPKGSGVEGVQEAKPGEEPQGSQAGATSEAQAPNLTPSDTIPPIETSEQKSGVALQEVLGDVDQLPGAGGRKQPAKPRKREQAAQAQA